MKLPRKPFAWTRGAPTTQFENPWFSAQTIPATDPNGAHATYGLVHFKNRAIGIVPFDGTHFWLVGQSRFAFENYSWEFPAGGGALDADPIETARRELREETGFRASTMTPLLEMHVSNSITDERAIIYLATDLTAGEAALESSEDISLQKFTLDDIIAAVEGGEIQQAITVAAIYKLAWMRETGRL